MLEYWHPPAPILDDVLDDLREAREMVSYLTRANAALTEQVERLDRELSISRMAQVVMDNSVAEVERLTAQLESTLQDRKLILADRDRLRAASGDVIRETLSSYRQAEEAYAAQLKAEAERDDLTEELRNMRPVHLTLEPKQ